ncbi:MAG TPA: DUF3095 domain-containing protein, partial [Gammaproteobacteria bacterium]|nr:DUF3095 domain-containing protein [Gammaproteobacteria bacterium]
QFYANIPPFDDFSGIADDDNYCVAPDDWHVVIADVKGSTRAIAEGRYKDVNMIGAACINAVLNISQKRCVPYVFGGDGASLMVHSGDVETATRVLLGVRDLAARRFNLSLRVGVVAVAEIHRQSGPRVKVARYRLSPGNELAAFSGGGMELAEQWIKAGDYLLEESYEDNNPDLSGLSCRWEPLASQNGVMLSVLMQAQAADDMANANLYRKLLKDIASITETGDGPVKPICDANLKLRWPPSGLRAEIDTTVGNRNRSWYALELYFYSLLQWVLDRFDITAGGYRGRDYRVELRNNTDYQRFDDTLRILIDCEPAQATAIEVMLESHAQNGVLRYGVHRSDSALMTCLVFNLDKGEHIHFVDGSDGGFTAAAKNMKAQKTAA